MRLLALILAAAAAGVAADRDFDRLANAIESNLGVRRTHIPLLGVANFFVKAARPAGARGFELAVFENLRLRPEDAESLDRVMAEAAAGLSLIVRTRSNWGRERTYVYAGDAAASRMFIVTFDRDEATIVEVKLNAQALARALANPEKIGGAHAGKSTKP